MRPSARIQESEVLLTLRFPRSSLVIASDNATVVERLQTRYEATESQKDGVADLFVRVRVGPRAWTADDARYEVSDERVMLSGPSFDADMSFATGQGEVRITSNRVETRLDVALRMLCSFLSFRGGGILLHGAGIVRDERGYVFFGPSGAGKSTVTNFSLAHQVLSDEHVVLWPGDNSVVVESSPFWNHERIPGIQAGQAKLVRLVRLAQAPSDRLEPVPTSIGSALLMQQAPYVNEHTSFLDRLMQITSAIAERCPVDILHFRKSDEFWKLL